MGALADLLKQPQRAATPATIATQSSAGVRSRGAAVAESQESQESQAGAPDIRAHLLALADADDIAAAVIHRLRAGDVAACPGLPDETLLAYLRALERGTVMDTGIAPEGYTQAAHCQGCGPVWLWQGAPARVLACPWCFRRNAGRALPRPPVKCGDCRHYSPDPLNPLAGIGRCGLGAGRALWPMKPHRCPDMRPPQIRPKQGDPLMISDSMGAQP